MSARSSKRYHFVHCTDNDGRPPTNALARKRLHRHVMLNVVADARPRTDAGAEQDEEDKNKLRGENLSHLLPIEAMTASNLPTPHEFNTTLQEIGIATFTKIDDIWKWQFLSDLKAIPRTGWLAEARDTWGTRLWDAALTDPLIFFTYLQVVLNKVATVTAENQDRKIHLLASKALPILNERLRNGGLNGHEAWCVSGFVYLAIRNKDYDLAKVHLRGMQLLLDIHEADRSSWPYIYLVDIRLAGLLNCRPFLRKSFNRSIWPSQASLSKIQAAIVERNAYSYMKRFGTGLAPFREMLRECFTQLLSCEMVQKSRLFSVVSQTEGLYSLSYDVCSLHGAITELPCDVRTHSTALVELVVIAIKLCTWSMCRYGVPQSGEVPEALLKRVAELLSTLPTDGHDFMDLLDTYTMDTGYMLWILFVEYVEAYQHYPRVQPALKALMKAMAARLGIKQPAQMIASLQRMPCVDLLYSKQSSFACRQIMSDDGSRWQPIEDWSFMRKKSPLTGFLTALQFDIVEGDIE